MENIYNKNKPELLAIALVRLYLEHVDAGELSSAEAVIKIAQAVRGFSGSLTGDDNHG